MNDVRITSRGMIDSCLGRVEQLKIYAENYRRLGWEEVWQAFAESYPGRWAVQVFPPASSLVNGKCVYHLFVCEGEPRGLNLRG